MEEEQEGEESVEEEQEGEESVEEEQAGEESNEQDGDCVSLVLQCFFYQQNIPRRHTGLKKTFNAFSIFLHHLHPTFKRDA